jgi:hypothetical protein
MLALNKNKTHLIFSVGKTGSSSLQKILNDDWISVGEMHVKYSEWIDPYHIDDKDRMMNQYEAVDEITFIHNPKVTCIIRDPWKRFVSGMKEVLQDYSYLLYADHDQFIENWNRIMSDENVCKEIIDRVFYITEFDTDEFYRKHTFNWHRSNAVFHNYHTKNWLHIVKEIPNANIVRIEELDDFIKSLGYTPIRENVSQKNHLDTISKALKMCNVSHIIDKYLEPEINIYNKIIR